MSLLSEKSATVIQSPFAVTNSLHASVFSIPSYATAEITVPNVFVNTVEVGDQVAPPVQFSSNNIAVTTSGGAGNISMGTSLPGLLTTGINNITLGNQPGEALTSGSNNVLLGEASGVNITTSSNNIAIGSISLAGLSGSGNIGIGSEIGLTGLGNNNIGIGTGSLRQAGDNNIVVGLAAAIGLIGNDNIVLGEYSFIAPAGNKNIALGSSINVGPGPVFDNSLAIGFNCVITGSNRVLIGRDLLAPNQNYKHLVLGTAPGGGASSSIVPGPYATDVAAGADPIHPAPLGGLYYDSNAGLSTICIRLT